MDVFNFLDKNKNDILHDMSNAELEEFINLLNAYLIEYRSTLNLDKKISFGLEIEVSKVTQRNLFELSRRYQGYADHIDISTYYGGEIVTPILIDEEKTWTDLHDICNDISWYSTNLKNCGGHIHVGAQILGNKISNYKKFLRLYEAFEHIIYRYSYGEFLRGRKTIRKYAPPCASKIEENFHLFDNKKMKINDIARKFQLEHELDVYAGLNLNHVKSDKLEIKNTIEFRMPNGTLNPIIWQNNVLFFTKLLESSRRRLDLEYLKYKILKNKDILDNLNEYQNIYLNDALELADLLFDNNLDKINFLRQYTKNFTVSKRGMQRCKKFTKY